MKKLIARKHILCNGKMYAPGSELPTNNVSITDAWLRAKTAAWVDKEKTIAAKARLVTAEPGLPGSAAASESENGEDLAGKIPQTSKRKRK